MVLFRESLKDCSDWQNAPFLNYSISCSVYSLLSPYELQMLISLLKSFSDLTLSDWNSSARLPKFISDYNDSQILIFRMQFMSLIIVTNVNALTYLLEK